MSSNAASYQKEYIKKHYSLNKDYYKDKNKKRRASLSTRRRLFESARQRAKTNGIIFTLEEIDIEMPDVCPVFKTRFVSSNKYTRASLDRIVPDLGYTKDNIQVISYRANWLKNNATIEEIEQLYKWYTSTA